MVSLIPHVPACSTFLPAFTRLATLILYTNALVPEVRVVETVWEKRVLADGFGCFLWLSKFDEGVDLFVLLVPADGDG